MGNGSKQIRNGIFLLAAAVAGLSANHASAITLPYTVPYSIINSYTSYSGYDVENIHDTGSNKFLTDYASQGGGTSTFIDMDFGVNYVTTEPAINHVFYMDRTSSGGGNGSNAGGPTDDVTSFSLIFTNAELSPGVPDFSHPLDTEIYQNGSDHVPPGGPKSFPPGDVTNASVLGLAGKGVLARYVEFKVDTINAGSGGNVGGSDLEFSAVPVPMAAVGGFGLFTILGLGKLRKSAVLG